MSNNIVLGLVVGVLVLFGLRGVLPEIFESVQMPALIAFISIGIAGFLAGRFAPRRERPDMPK